jgi:hypothetical protein
MSRKELLAKCEELNLKNYKSKNKAQLIELLNKKESFKKDSTPTECNEERLDNLNKALTIHTLRELADMLNVAPGTITRWKELKDVPSAYEFDLLKLLNIKIDYSIYTPKQKDQFFTPVETAKYCYEAFLNKLKELPLEKEEKFKYIEPSAGDGSFLQVLPKDRTISFDIEPRHKDIIQQDFLTWTPEYYECLNAVKVRLENIVVFGNPPFGLRGNLALRFINHAAKFADFVCFILPQLFESDGKGVPRKRVEGLSLIHSEKLKTKFHEPGKKEVEINTIFQIWAREYYNNDYELKENDNKVVKVYSLSDGGTPSSTRNKDMLNKCDLYLPSTCFGKENMKIYSSFEELPGRKGYGLVFNENKQENIAKCKALKWNEIAFLSTNSAYNLRSSQIYNLF